MSHDVVSRASRAQLSQCLCNDLASSGVSRHFCQGRSVLGSLPDGTVVSSNSARCHRARTGDKSGRHLLSGGLPRIDVTMTEELFAHQSVMLEDICNVFAAFDSGIFLDATLGGAGHSRALLEQHPRLSLLGVDQDANALAAATERLSDFSARVTLRRARFNQIASVCAELDVTQLHGALFDLGVSSPQFDRPERGFSYRFDGPLDMRMDQRQELTADIVVNSYDIDSLTQIISRYSDERFAARIARAIVAARPLSSTLQLAGVITTAIPAATRRRGGHPAKRTFQAIRIEVNSELEILESSLNDVIDLLAPGARLAVLTFHSGEDRIVKAVMRHAETGGCRCPAGLPCGCGAITTVRRVRVSRTASSAEVAVNPRAASARLRVVEKIPQV